MIEGYIQAALGKVPSDLIIEGDMINTLTGDIEYARVAVYDGMIVGIGDYRARQVIRCKYLCPGLIDGHVHIESSMLSPQQFSMVVAGKGTTAIVADPHEIANVTGIDGLLSFMEEAGKSPVKIFFTIPSCVPASPLEMSNGQLDARDMKRLSGLSNVVGIGEMMDFNSVLGISPEAMDRLYISSVIDGHAPGLSGHELNAYIAAGIDSDHECISTKEALEKLRRGMWLMVREGGCTKNLKDVIGIVNEVKDTRRIMLVTDDRDAFSIVREGHMDHLVRLAIVSGVDPVRAIQMATINPATRFGLRAGAIMPGMTADIVLLDDLPSFKINSVLINGKLYREADIRDRDSYMPGIRRANTVHMPCLSVDDIAIRSDVDRTVRVIGIRDNSIYTDALTAEMKSEDGVIRSDPAHDLLKICSIRRYPGSGMIAKAFASGFGLMSGAVAQTILHDSHNIIAIGASDTDIMAAIDRLGHIGGGIAVSSGGRIVCDLPLPYAGLMSDLPADKIAISKENINHVLHDMGSKLTDPIMRLSFLGLSVVPKLKITCRGLVDVDEQRILSLFVDEDTCDCAYHP